MGIDAASNFILLERYAPNRESVTWTAALTEALADLPQVTVVAATSDEGRGLVAAVKRGLGAHHSPDVFHPLQDLWRALARPLAHSLKAPQAVLAKAEQVTAGWRDAQREYWSQRRNPGRPPAFDQHIAQAQAREDAARQTCLSAVATCDEAEKAIRDVSRAYHPVDPTTGRLRDAATVEADLAAAFQTLDAAADAIDLGTERRDLLDKARRVMPKLVATIAFFHGHVSRCLGRWNATEPVREIVRTQLIPALYVQSLAQRAPSAAERETLRATAVRLRRQAYQALAAFPATLSHEALNLATECVAVFVRASSCVEGRNGHLALWHHSLHRLSDRRLTCLTVIANYHQRRTDGTTAAERFFDAPHEDLFEWLLDHLDVPARPRSRQLQRAA